jgi:hypothetical protein
LSAGKKRWNETCEIVKWLNDAKLDLEDASVIWTGQMNAKNGKTEDVV